jgi:hypothetical protein
MYAKAMPRYKCLILLTLTEVNLYKLYTLILFPNNTGHTIKAILGLIKNDIKAHKVYYSQTKLFKVKKHIHHI